MEENLTEGEVFKDGSIVKKHRFGYCLLQCPDVEHYTIPDEVVDISPSAFEQAKHLLSVNFNNVTSLVARKEYIYKEVPYFEGTGWAGYEETLTGIVYHSIFENCPLVCNIEMPHMKSIYEFALSGMKQLRTLTLPDSLKLCSNHAFYDSAIETIRSNVRPYISILRINGNDIFYTDHDGYCHDIDPEEYRDGLASLL